MKKHSAFSIQHSAFENGLSLIEVLIVMAVFSVISVIAIQIFNSSIRATNKAKVTSEVEESGKTLLDVISRRVRQAKEIPYSNSGLLELKNIDGQLSVIYYKFTAGTNGQIWIDENFTGTLGGYPLSNTDPVSGVDISGCYFIATTGYVKISFNVKPGVQSPSYNDFIKPVEFSQTVSLRN